MDTNNKVIDNITDNLFYAIPVMHKRLMRIDPPDLDCGLRLSRLHIGTLGMLSEGTCSISEIANTFFIPKSQMSYLIERMVQAGLLERTPNRRDRRVTDVTLTARGRAVFKQCDEYLKHNVRTLLSTLTPGELNDLSDSLVKLKEIGAKLAQR
jgi:MarR family transcriptional regulator, 2-MHQ and catechol-resistance regulon repressor